jgi:hypothetical protein
VVVPYIFSIKSIKTLEFLNLWCYNTNNEYFMIKEWAANPLLCIYSKREVRKWQKAKAA